MQLKYSSLSNDREKEDLDQGTWKAAELLKNKLDKHVSGRTGVQAIW